MGVKWTSEQQQVIDLRDRNILVSAAAGSGKTAVLVERIIKMISDEQHPVDIDRLLVVTFTNAAAGEMRERIREAIECKLDEEPDNEHLRRQTTLVHNAQITTIHSFCQYVIRNYFYALDLDPGFRIGDEGEMKLLRNEVAEKLMEEAYAKKDSAFETFVESYAPGKSDDEIIEYILQIYNFSMSDPWPLEWLKQCKEAYRIETMEELEQASWMGHLLKNVGILLQDVQGQIEDALRIIGGEDGPYMYEEALQADKALVEHIIKAGTYQEYAIRFQKADKFSRMSPKRDAAVSEEKKELVKSIREQIKKTIQEIRKQYFYTDPQQVLNDIKESRETIEILLELTAEFLKDFTEKKRERGLLDFNDLEHLALDILVEKEEGQGVPSEIARNLSEHFVEIMIDEYQDSNLVQESILTSVSRTWKGDHNIFMVGDVKQSIYRFRLARPELFMKKYESYSLEGPPCQRIDLHKNFRSRGQVLNSVNFIFQQIMADYLGKIEYDDAAALYTGAKFPKGNSTEFAKTELLLLDLDAEPEIIQESGENVRELEARMVAKRIQEIVGKEWVLDKKTGEYREAEYRDIVILLRSVSGWAEVFSRVLENHGIPSYTGSRTGYFTAVEIQTILSLLKIIDNPKQEIPMTAVLSSPIVGLSADELAAIKSSYPCLTYDEACKHYAKEGEDRKLLQKLEGFFAMLEDFRKQVPYTAMHELLLYVLKKTGYGDYAAAMPAGEQRQANLNMLVEKSIAYESTSYKGLFNFVRYIENLQKYDVDFGEASVLGEEENTLRIMSIHKSKGLEFPIVFVSGMHKKFNQQDTRRRLILHQELGLGSDYVDPLLRVRTPTLLKKLLQREISNENLGEELRVLYVALTRAKEKLIMTGAVPRLENYIKKWSVACRRKEIKLSFSTLTGAATYLDWVMPCVLRHQSGKSVLESYDLAGNIFHSLYDCETEFVIWTYDGADLVQEESKRQITGILSREALLNWDTCKVFDEQVRQSLLQNLNAVYPYEKSLGIYGKVTVSELKKNSGPQEISEEYQIYEEQEIIPYVPKFMKKEEETDNAAKGTIYHKFLEHLDFGIEPTILAIKEQLEQFCQSGRLTALESSWIDVSKIYGFLNSKLGRRMRQAAAEGRLYREQPFVIGVEADQIQPQWETDDMVLIQGIIDAYFYEGDSMVLVDYKTDFIKAGEERSLLDKYHLQLRYYGEALERMSGKQIKEKIIYSFWLQKELSNK